jgi:transglutaminase-like putative cysteine protease
MSRDDQRVGIRASTGSVRYRVRHETTYEYGSEVVHSHQLLHLVPRPSPYQQCHEHLINLSPACYRKSTQADAFGNIVTRVEFDHPHRKLEVSTDMQIEVHSRPPVVAADSFQWERAAADLNYRNTGPSREKLDACRFRHESPHVRIKRLFTDYAADCFPPERPILACAQALMSKLHQDIRYSPGETTIATPATEVLKSRRGVCQDYAHLMISCLRSRGLAARYVSGYLRQIPSAGADVEAECERSEERTALVGWGASHAWVAVYTPPLGWIELDPTNDLYVGTDHICLAWGRDFGDVSPLRGVILGGGHHRLTVGVKVEQQHAP